MANIQAKVLTVKDKVFFHNNRKEKPEFFMESIYDKDFIYTESPLFQTYNSFELLKAYTYKKNHDFIDQNPIGEDGKKRRKLKNNIELLTEVVINFNKEIFEKNSNPNTIHQSAEKLAIDFFAKELGFQILSVATHLDEHHKDDEEQRNYHTHITLLNYDFHTHKTVKRTLSKKHLISIQDIVAKQYEPFGFAKASKTSDELVLNINSSESSLEEHQKVIDELKDQIAKKDQIIKELQESNTPKDTDDELIEKLQKKNKNLSELISIILEELNVSQDEISNLNFHAIEDMRDVVYKKLDMLKLYEFLNVGFAPTEEEVNLNTIEENFKKHTNTTPKTTINITTEEL